MGLMDMFKAAPVAKEPGNIDPAAATNSQGVSNAATAPNGVVPATSAEAMKSPLDEYNTLWDTDPNAPKPAESMFANVDGKKMMESAGKVDFTKAVTPELMQKIQAGGADAVQATIEAMGKMSQLTFANSAMATTKIVEQALAKQEEKYKSELPNHIRKQSVSNSLRSENPALSHPAAQPILGAIESQMADKYPNATAAEVTSMAKDYLAKFASLVSPQKQEETSDSSKGGTDFSDWDL